MGQRRRRAASTSRSAYFVFVAIDDEGRPRPVPPLETETPATYDASARPRSAARTGWPARRRSTRAGKDDAAGVHARTARLWLDEPVEADVDDLFAIHADPASWRHFPSGRVTDPARRRGRWSARAAASSRATGWPTGRCATAQGGPVIGRGGWLPDEALEADPTGRAGGTSTTASTSAWRVAATRRRWASAALEAAHDVAPGAAGARLPARAQPRLAPHRREARAAAGLARARTPTTPTPTPSAWCTSTASPTTSLVAALAAEGMAARTSSALTGATGHSARRDRL